MTEVEEQSSVSVGVFQDVSWAERGLAALLQHGFTLEDLTVLSKKNEDAAALVEKTFGVEPLRLELRGFGETLVHGKLIDTLQGSDGALVKKGVAATMRRVGFQDHDGFIFETLTSRGGVLVAIESEPLAADALTLLHAYGGGNAAIGAWTGRV